MSSRILHVLELQQQLDDDQIATLVHRFYGRVQQDPLLGPVFGARIADDGWPAHLDKMVRFWSTILRGTNRYRGDPMAAHRELVGVTEQHFTRWLGLFREVAEGCLPRQIADSILQRAERMRERLRAQSS